MCLNVLLVNQLQAAVAFPVAACVETLFTLRVRFEPRDVFPPLGCADCAFPNMAHADTSHPLTPTICPRAAATICFKTEKVTSEFGLIFVFFFSVQL